MAFTNTNLQKTNTGFTIVELLIVIVVIAILATISIVAYTGVQNRARDTTNKSDAQTIVKVAEAVNAESGAYPTNAAGFTSSSISKLPSNIAVTVGSKPTNAAAKTAADGTPRTYTIALCTNGADIWYPDRASATPSNVLQIMKAGAGCGGTAP